MATVLTKKNLQETIETIQQVYMEDNIPWICGYSGGKDSSAVVQLVWMALKQLPKEKRTKTVHVISTDTLVQWKWPLIKIMMIFPLYHIALHLRYRILFG